MLMMLMNKTMARSYDLPDLPATKKKEFWNPDGEAFQQQIPMNRPKQPSSPCGRFKVVNGHIICQVCVHNHSMPVKDIDKFIEENKDKMEPLAR